jgi:TonB family protein
MRIFFLTLVIVITGCEVKKNNRISTIEDRYLKFDTSYSAKEAFDDSICKIAVDSARTRFKKNRFELYVFYKSDSSSTPIQLLRSKFKMQTITFAREDFVFKFCYNDAMIAAFEDRHHFNPIDSVTAVYDSLLRIGQTQKNPEFPGGFKELEKYMICNLEYPRGEDLAPPYPSVLVSFTISPSGDPDKIEIVEGSSADYNNAVLRLIRMMPKWSPPQDDYGKYDDGHIFQWQCRFDPIEKRTYCR